MKSYILNKIKKEYDVIVKQNTNFKECCNIYFVDDILEIHFNAEGCRKYNKGVVISMLNQVLTVKDNKIRIIQYENNDFKWRPRSQQSSKRVGIK